MNDIANPCSRCNCFPCICLTEDKLKPGPLVPMSAPITSCGAHEFMMERVGTTGPHVLWCKRCGEIRSVDAALKELETHE